MDWTTEQVAELTRFWNDGLTATEIGKRLGVTKSAVVGKANRLGLPGRPSPIKSTSRTAGQIAERRRIAWLMNTKPRAIIKFRSEPPRMNRNTARDFVPDPAKTVTSPLKPGRCNYPLWGDDEKPTHRYCGHDAVPGSTYCAAHRAICTTAAQRDSSEAA